MTPSRIAALVAIVLGVFALAIVGLRGGSSNHYTLVFDDAGGLIKGNLLRVNGQKMGVISDIGITKDLKAKVGISVQELGPLRQGTTAQIRATSLGGVANKYIALSLGPNNAARIPENAVIGTNQTRGITGQDEFVNAFDPATRKGLQELVKGNAEIVQGNPANLQKVLKNAPGTLDELRRFSKDLDPDDSSLRKIIVNGATISGALADQTAAISRLTGNAGVASQALAGNGTEIAQTLGDAPKALDEGTAVLTELPSTLNDVKALITKLDSVKAGVPRTLDQLTDTLTSGESTIGALARSLNKPGSDNDVADLLKAAVSVGDAATKASKTVPKGLTDATPLLAQTRAYTPDVISALTGLGLMSANYDAAGHYLRLSPVLNLLTAQGTGTTQDLVPRESFVNRLAGLTPTTNRCPGSAAQAPADGSAPFTDNGAVSCNTGDVPPGP